VIRTRRRGVPSARGLGALALCAACGRIGYQDLYGDPRDAGDSALPRDAAAGGSAESAAPGDGSSPGDAVSTETGDDGAPDVGGAETSPGGSDARDETPDAPACSVTATASSDYCATIPWLPQAPVIDGAPDCSIPLIDLTPIGWSGGTPAPDATAQYAVAWRPDGIYCFVHVSDPSLVPADPSESTWQGDAVEIYADSDGTYAAPPAYDNPGTRQFTVAAPASPQSSIARAQIWYTGSVSGAAWTSMQFRAFGAPDGYVVEAFVTGPDLGLPPLALAAGGHVGLDLSIDVSYPTDRGPDAGGFGNRFGQYYLRVATPDAGAGIPPFDVRAFCTPALAAM
jgi:hypothetical protein